MEADVLNFGLLKARRNYDAFYDKVSERLDIMHSNLITQDLEISALVLGCNASALHVLVKTYDCENCDTPEYGYTFQNHLTVAFHKADGSLVNPAVDKVAYPISFSWIDHRNKPFEYGLKGFRMEPFLKLTIEPLGAIQRPSVPELSITYWIDSIADTAALAELYLALVGIEQQLEHLKPCYEFLSNQTVRAFIKGVRSDYVVTIETHPEILINNIALLLCLADAEGVE